MCAMALAWAMWKEIFADLVLVGKILFFPLLAFFTVAMLPVAIVELLAVDSIVMLILAFCKSISTKDLFEFLFY